MTGTISPIEAAQDAFRRQDWARARDRFYAARQAGLLNADGLFALAEAAWWLGEMDESLAASKQAYRQYLQAGRPLRAAMAAMFLGARFSERGDLAVGSGWMSRTRRLLHDQPEDANGFGLSFRDPDNIALELWAPLP